MKRLMASAMLFVLGGCGHALMRGSVVMKVSDTEAHVCLGKGEVREGSNVELYRHVCVDRGRVGVAVESCRREPAGSGKVTRVLNDHYSVVQFTSGTPFQEGDSVEARRR